MSVYEAYEKERNITMQMDYKRNARYFTGAMMGKLSTICWIVAVACAVLLFLRIWWLYWISGLVGLTAVICAIVFSTRSVSDSEYEGTCNGLDKAFRTRMADFINAELNKNNGRGKAPVAVNEEKIRYSRSFLYDGETMLRVGQDDRRRTGKLSFAAYLLEKNRVFIGYEMHGLVTEAHEEVFGVYTFESISSIEAFRPENLSPLAEYVRVRIQRKASETPIEFWRANDAELDELLSAVRSRLTDETEQDAAEA